MDPNATLKQIDVEWTLALEGKNLLGEPLLMGDLAGVFTLCEGLRRRLKKGCFPPDWDAYPTGTECYQFHISAQSGSWPESPLPRP